MTSNRRFWLSTAITGLVVVLAVLATRNWHDPAADEDEPISQATTTARTKDGKDDIRTELLIPAGQSQRDGDTAQDPSLPELIRKMEECEQLYFPYDIKALETFRFPDDLTPRERGRSLRADGRKHQNLMEYAQLAPRIWRSSETILVDDQLEQGPYVKYSDGARIVQISPAAIQDGTQPSQEVHIENDPAWIFTFLHARPLYGIFCLSAYGDSKRFSEVFSANPDAVELHWDDGDARLSFAYGHPQMKQRYLLWLSREHDWHPIRLQRFWTPEDEEFHDEWEVTRFIRRGNAWRVAEGTHRYRDRDAGETPGRPFAYALDFEVLEEKYGLDVDKKRFEYENPADDSVHEEAVSSADRRSTAREIALSVRDTDESPISNASIRFESSQLPEAGSVTTDEHGVARIAEAPQGNVAIDISAAGFRPATWIVGDVDQLRAILAPVTPGVVLADGVPAEGVWLTNKVIQVRSDGLTSIPWTKADGGKADWSDDQGRFLLQTNLTLRRGDSLVPIISVHPSLEQMAIRVVPANELGQQQILHLQRTCLVHGHCLLEGVPEFVEVDATLLTSGGQPLGNVVTRQEVTPSGLRVAFNVRMPPGDYVLHGRALSGLATFSLPLSVSPGQDELDLGTTTVPASGLMALSGKPAPELDVVWRPGQEESWDSLRGNVVVLDFWGTWCGPCIRDMPLLMDIADQFRGQPVHWIAIHTPNLTAFDELDRQLLLHQAKSWNSRALPFATVLDRPVDGEDFTGKTSHGFGIAAWPTLVVIDQHGHVVGPTNKNQLAETLSRLLDQDILAP